MTSDAGALSTCQSNPQWNQAPPERFVLGHLPTPIHEWSPPGVPEGMQLWIKRDDLTGMQLSGNKV
jgi:1-aminocyclopropane-1-carboxylate deaminase/D-cysteine desulfhydrase-like pyridoxal-dependent ACC family enzyme